MAVHAMATAPFFSLFQMDPELFHELEKIAYQIEEDGAVEIGSLLQIAIFFSTRSSWWLNDRRHV